MNETRILAFTPDEVLTALRDHRRRREAPLPLGTIKSLRLTPNPPSACLLVLDHAGREHACDFAEAEIAACLIAYCVTRRVPLPARGRKTLQVTPTGAVLTINVCTKHGDASWGIRARL